MNQSETEKNKAEQTHTKADRELKAASQHRQNAETLIQKYKSEIPVQGELADKKREIYKNFLKEKQISDSDWKKVAEENRADKEQKLLETVNKYKEDLNAARVQQQSALEAVENKEKPNIENLQTEKDLAENNYQRAEVAFNQIKQIFRDDREILDTLSERMENRKAVLEEHRRLDTLYRMASGNVSGARMDLETYVQRYFLRRILYAANLRFQEMSGGQFELRMVEEAEAGDGKNRGLDLMVYSAVTGKVREIRTLSGGESFLAALSLALGMADQIKESAPGIHLDVMFLDEGFGSLDESARDQAVRVLQEMAGASRLIGIISHVTELKQEIDDQLLVTKDEHGSHVRWQIS